jgi:molybdopterin/thiamine biosynthesis adenylyltransferase
MCTDYPWATVTYKADELRSLGAAERVTDRQDRLVGFSSQALAQSSVLCIGAGGLGGEICSGLTTKGIGRLHIVDSDQVEPSNLNRQRFRIQDLYRPKALRLAHHCARDSALGSVVTGHFTAFCPQTAPLLAASSDVAVVGVDSDWCRAVASQFFRQKRIPVIFTAVDEQASWGWIFVQEASGPCLTCLLPYMANAGDEPTPCTASQGTVDILRVMSGHVLYAIDTLLMPRPRDWNSRSVFLRGDVADCRERIPARRGCPTCQVLGGGRR